MAGKGGGAWKVAYADFVTAMMAFFMVMWILGMDQQLRQAIEGYFSNPVGYKKGYSRGATPISSGASPATVKTKAVFLASRE
jgi:chemotaxis protein MotB